MKATLDGDRVAFTCQACNEPAVRLTQHGTRWTAWCGEHRPRIPPDVAVPARYCQSLTVLMTGTANYLRNRGRL